MAIAHTLLKIAYQVLKTGTPYTDLGVGFYASREAPQARQAYLIRQLQKLNPGCRILGAADAYQAMREPRPGVPFQLVPVVGEVVECFFWRAADLHAVADDSQGRTAPGSRGIAPLALHRGSLRPPAEMAMVTAHTARTVHHT